jgi:hypothetical protein
MEKRKFLTLLGLEPQPLGRPARSQLLYRLRYLETYKWGSINETEGTMQEAWNHAALQEVVT